MLQAERQAVNTTVQGSAADIVKAAMNMIDQELVHAFPHTRFPHRHHDAGLRPACMRVCVCVCACMCVCAYVCYACRDSSQQGICVILINVTHIQCKKRILIIDVTIQMKV